MGIAKKIPIKNKGGRPSKFDSIDQKQVAMLAEKGWIDREMANFFGVTEQTWNNYKKKHPEFFESLKKSKEVADAKVERSLFERATGYEHPEDKIFNDSGVPLIVPTTKHYPPDPISMIFWLKNRRPDLWKDKQEIDHKTPVPIKFVEDLDE